MDKNTGIKIEVIDEICKLAEECSIEKIILFGSRARGDYKNTSDIDLAISGGNGDRFSFLVEEDTNTLLKYDIVNLDYSVQKELLESIRREGRVLYEKI